VTQQVAARREGGFQLFSDALFLRLLSSSVALAVLLVIASFESRADMRHLVRFYGIGILFVNLLSADHMLTALEMFHARSLLAVTQQTVYALGIFTFVRTPRDIVWVPLSILASSAISGVAGWALLSRRGFKLAKRLQPRQWKEIFAPSAHYAASTLMSNLYHRSGHLLVRWFLGDFALGLYAAAVRLVDLLRGFVIIVLQVLMPRMALSAISPAELRRLARFALAVIAVVSIPLAVGLMSTAHLIVPWVLGAKYLADVNLVRWMALYLITAPAASLFAGTILFSMGRHRSYLTATAGGAIAGVLLYITLIPAFGLTGAGLAFVLAEVAVAATGYGLLPRELRDSWKNPLLGIALAGTVLMFVAIRVVNAHTTQIFAVVSAGAVAYLLSCSWFIRKTLVGQLFGSR
jgi:O-antigen/teichoic acid export membrane protein